MLQLKRSKIKAVEDAELANLQESVQRLKLEEALDVERLVLEERLELQNVEVVDAGQVAQEAELQGVDVEEIVQVDLVEALKTVEGVDIELESTLLEASGRGGGSSNSQSRQGRDEESDGLHLANWTKRWVL